MLVTQLEVKQGRWVIANIGFTRHGQEHLTKLARWPSRWFRSSEWSTRWRCCARPAERSGKAQSGSGSLNRLMSAAAIPRRRRDNDGAQPFLCASCPRMGSKN